MRRFGLFLAAVVLGGGLITAGAALGAFEGAEKVGTVLMLAGGAVGYLISCLAGRSGNKHKAHHHDEE